MDSITHSLLGAALAKTRLGRVSPFSPGAPVVAANLPDFENLVLAFCDQPANMMHHRSVTHSVLGVLVLAPLFALLVRGLEWRFARRRAGDASDRRVPPAGSLPALIGAIFLATATHPILDWLNTYGVRPWLPFDGTWYHGDLVFIVDPWLWLLLGGTVALAGRRTPFGHVVLAALGLLMLVIVWLATPFVPAALPVVFVLALPALAAARYAGVGRRRADAVVAGSLALGIAYVGFLGWAGRTARETSMPVIAAALPEDERIVARTVSPQPADPLRWQIIAQTERAVYRHTFSILDAPGGVVRLESRPDHPAVRKLAETRAVRAWRVFARHPVAVVANRAGGERVYLLDARYPMFPARGFSSITIDVPDTTWERVIPGPAEGG
jgi:inner membrane protein